MRGSCCLVPRPEHSARPKRFGSRGPSEDLFPTRSPRIRHLSELTERDWERAVQRLGKGSCIRGPLGSRFPALTSLFWLCGWQEWSWFFDPRLIRLLGIWKRTKMLQKISFGSKGYYSGPRRSSHHEWHCHTPRFWVIFTDLYKYCPISSVAWGLWQEIFGLVRDIPLQYLLPSAPSDKYHVTHGFSLLHEPRAFFKERAVWNNVRAN